MTNSKSSQNTLTGNLVHEVSSLIRHKILTLPALKPLDNPHPIVENDDVFIINEMNIGLSKEIVKIFYSNIKKHK